MLHLRTQVEQTLSPIRQRWKQKPVVGIVLGSGLSGIVERVRIDAAFDYRDLPHFPAATSLGHPGRFICGRLGNVPMVAMQGRLHLYEGYTATQIVLPIQAMKALGVQLLVVSSAAGGLVPYYRSGDVMVIDDHINLMFRNPLIGINDESWGPRFPDMSAPYDQRLIALALQVARQANFVAHRGVYVGVLGPNYETRAEYRCLRRLGGHAVGMSTVPEVIAAAHAGLTVLGLSTVANVASPDALTPTSGQEVVDVVKQAGDKIAEIIQGVVAHEFT